MFNNAGISIGGETEELTLDHWNSIIDVNIRGVVHGVHAAYPVMVAQGSGHIVNTASMGGLMAAGLLHVVRHDQARRRRAVAGAALGGRRARRRRHRGLPVGRGHPDPRQGRGRAGSTGATTSSRARAYAARSTQRCSRRRCSTPSLENRPLLVTPRTARIAWRIGRLSPSFVAWSSIRFVGKQRKLQAKRAARTS